MKTTVSTSRLIKIASRAIEWCQHNQRSWSAPISIVTALSDMGLLRDEPQGSVWDSELMVKVLKIAAQICWMHGRVAGDRVCQDWGGPTDVLDSLTHEELDRLQLEFEEWNSGGEDYIEGYYGWAWDEMCVSFAVARQLDMMIRDLDPDWSPSSDEDEGGESVGELGGLNVKISFDSDRLNRLDGEMERAVQSLQRDARKVSSAFGDLLTKTYSFTCAPVLRKTAVEDLEAGELLDYACAVARPFNVGELGEPVLRLNIDNAARFMLNDFAPSTNCADAIQLVAGMDCNGFRCQIRTPFRPGDSYWARFTPHHPDRWSGISGLWAAGPTREVAICRAFLTVHGVEFVIGE